MRGVWRERRAAAILGFVAEQSPLRFVAIGAASAAAAVAVFFAAWSSRGGGDSAPAAPVIQPRPPQPAPAPPPEGGERRFEVRDPRCTGSADGATCVFELVPSWGKLLTADPATSSVSVWADDLGTDLAAKLDRPVPNQAGVSAAAPGADRGLRVTLATPRAPAAAARSTMVSGVLKASAEDAPTLEIPYSFTAPLARDVLAR